MTNVCVTKSGFIEDETIFNFFKEEAAIVAEQDIGCIDEGLEIIIYLLNKFPGIATRSSCAGHPDRTDSDDFHLKPLRDEILIKLMRYDSCDLFFGPELRAESGTPKEEVK